MNEYPLHELLKERRSELETIQNFLTWLLDEHRIDIHVDEDTQSMPVFLAADVPDKKYDDFRTIRLSMGDSQRGDLIGAYFGVDPVELEKEKRKMLDDLRRTHEIEVRAKEVYNSWKIEDGWVPWVEGGNSTMQERARNWARVEKNARRGDQ